MKTLRAKVSPSSRVTPKSLLKSLPADENQGIVQPMRFRIPCVTGPRGQILGRPLADGVLQL
jgi:hypothetical protein